MYKEREAMSLQTLPLLQAASLTLLLQFVSGRVGLVGGLEGGDRQGDDGRGREQVAP